MKVMQEHATIGDGQSQATDRNHSIAIEPNGNRMVVSYAGRIIADTRDALILREGDYPEVLYIPKRDIDMSAFEKSDHMTRCPYKGDCTYFSISVEGRRSPSAAWTYETPLPSVIAIRDHLAFYRDRVDSIKEL